MKTSTCLLIMLFFSLVSPAVFANRTPTPKQPLTTEQQLRFDQISRRVEEIRTMDKANLSRMERKQLRGELVELKKEARVMQGGVYLSVGAIIIIILVLILLL